MADNFGLKIGLEGEKEFKKALADINQSFRQSFRPGAAGWNGDSQRPFCKTGGGQGRRPNQARRPPPQRRTVRSVFLRAGARRN